MTDDLACLFAAAIVANRERLARAEAAYPGEPIQVVLDYQPAMKSVRLAIRPVDNAPPFRLGAA